MSGYEFTLGEVVRWFVKPTRSNWKEGGQLDMVTGNIIAIKYRAIETGKGIIHLKPTLYTVQESSRHEPIELEEDDIATPPPPAPGNNAKPKEALTAAPRKSPEMSSTFRLGDHIEWVLAVRGDGETYEYTLEGKIVEIQYAVVETLDGKTRYTPIHYVAEEDDNRGRLHELREREIKLVKPVAAKANSASASASASAAAAPPKTPKPSARSARKKHRAAKLRPRTKKKSKSKSNNNNNE